MLLVAAILAAAIAAVAYSATAHKRRRTPEERRVQRRYARIPISLDVSVSGRSGQVNSRAQNISVDGMLLQEAAKSLGVAEPVQLAFVLPEETSVQIPGVVWRHQGHDAVVRFDPTHPERMSIQKWVAHAERSLSAEKETYTTGV